MGVPDRCRREVETKDAVPILFRPELSFGHIEKGIRDLHLSPVLFGEILRDSAVPWVDAADLELQRPKKKNNTNHETNTTVI